MNMKLLIVLWEGGQGGGSLGEKGAGGGRGKNGRRESDGGRKQEIT